MRNYCGIHKDLRKEIWPRVWWRRINFKRTDENFKILVKFTEETLGRTYELNELKLSKKFTSIMDEKKIDNMEISKLTRKISITHSDIEREENGGYDNRLV